MASYGEVAEDSIYRQKGSEKYAQVKKAYLRQHLEAANKAKNGGKCEEARQHVEAALTVDEGNAEAQDILKSCGAVAKPVVKPVATQEHKPHAEKSPSVATAPAAKVKEKPTVEEPPQPNPAAEKLLQDAQDAYVHGQYANAIETAKKAVEVGAAQGVAHHRRRQLLLEGPQRRHVRRGTSSVRRSARS